MLSQKKKNKIRESAGDRILQGFTTAVLLVILIIVAFPVLHVLASSFSSATAISTGKVVIWPVNFTLEGYKFTFRYRQIWIGFRNSILYTIGGVAISMSLNTLCAYPLSRPTYQGKNMLMKIFFFTTLFHAGLIPTYLVKSALGMVNTIWAVLLAGALGVRNMIILRTAFRNSVPGELYDAAAIDGANEFQIMWKIALPLVKATVSVLILYTAVGCWNEYFESMIYLRDTNLYPLQLFLRTILTAAQSLDLSSVSSSDMLAVAESSKEQIQYAMMVLTTVPLLLMYAMAQKYFEKGVMIGSVKG